MNELQKACIELPNKEFMKMMPKQLRDMTLLSFRLPSIEQDIKEGKVLGL